ncbi:DUF296 domain-containing protein [Candidatus Kaiserbacteria bacterium]|nr:DUF296 domain-containing protein [Candidatus Kaiserbacteria bacterium]
MKYTGSGTSYIIRLERGEEMISTLSDFLATEGGARSAIFQGIGALERVKIGYYDLAKKEYYFRKEQGVFEVASMQGNVSVVDGKPFIHAHAVLSRCDESCACIGAHIKEAYVAVTLEVFLTMLEREIGRVHDDVTGLKLLDL